MKKLVLNLNSALDGLYLQDPLNLFSQSMDCPIEDCKGTVRFTASQRNIGAAAICSKCKRAIILKETKC